ncbi:MAG: TatD family hydrolase, partial [Nitrospinota bacterium]
MVPYIDSHNHMQGLSWDDWETLAMTGLVGAVLSCGNPHVHREMWEEAPGPEDIRRFWESPIRLARVSEEKHFIRLGCAVGISSMMRVRDWPRLVEALPGYLRDPHVVAVGEVGLDPAQYFGLTWPLEDQARCLEAQARVAAEMGVPLILHTPTPKKSRDFLGGVTTQGEVSGQEYRLHYLRRDLEVIGRAGLEPSLLVVDHADATTIDFVHAETRAWCAISIGSELRPIRPQQVAEWVKRYGSERILLNSDHIPYRSTDL